ncbi:MAG: Hpt domain-containing protein, partial [Thermodesulfobacteriota bacterium]|nr:Hpt domain-containing protein [Thermodesulfobacteriota bacterium]
MEIAKLAEDLGLGIDDISELLELYVQTTSCNLEELRAGLNAKDADEVHKKAHSIKGASGNLGLHELYRLAKEIDDLAIVGSLEGLEALVQLFQKEFENFAE